MPSPPKPTFKQKVLSYFSQQIETTSKSAVNPYLEVALVNGKRTLNTKNANFSFGTVNRIFDKVFTAVEASGQSFANILILGYGAGNAARLLREKYGQNAPITGVEKDPETLRLAKTYFDLEAIPNTTIVEADARLFLRDAKPEYDLIIIDIFDDINVPAEFVSENFLAKVRDALLLTGPALVVLNTVAQSPEQKKRYTPALARFEKVFGAAQRLEIKEFSLNWVFVYRNY